MFNFKINGRLCSDPSFSEYGTPPNPMATVRVASNHPGVDQADFFTVALFGEKALKAIAGAHKGDSVKLSGSGRQNVWDSADGVKHETVALRAHSVELKPRKRDAEPAAVDHVAEVSTSVVAGV